MGTGKQRTIASRLKHAAAYAVGYAVGYIESKAVPVVIVLSALVALIWLKQLARMAAP